MTKTFNKTALALAISPMFFAAMAHAQQDANAQQSATAQQSTDKEIEVIEVKGFGATLGKSLRQKKLADSVVEIVSTDDLGSLPDVTIADAIARLPGVAAERDRGNASSISIRGMGPRLNMATMNGREIVSAEPSREVRYEQFPSELINSVEVYKSPVANQVEGGISGLVNMNFISPLAAGKQRVTVTGHLMDYQLGHDMKDSGADANGHKESFSYVDQFGENFGVVIGLTYQDQPSLQRETSSWGYNKTQENQGDVNGDGITEAAPWGGKAATKLGDNQRTGAMTILEWQASEQLNLKYDVFYSEFDITEQEDQFWFDNWGNWAGGSNWNYNNSKSPAQIITKADGSQQLTGGGVLWGNHSANNATWFQANELLSTGLKSVWNGDVWTISSDVGYSEASIESRWVNITSSWSGTGPVDVQWNTQGGRLAVIVDKDISNPADYRINGMTVDGDRELTDKMTSAKLDFERSLEWNAVDTLSFGARVSDREKDNDVISWWQGVTNPNLADYGHSYQLGGDFVSPALYSFKNWQSVADQGFGGIHNRNSKVKVQQDHINSWFVSETNSAAYAMVKLRSEIFGLPYTGNAGVRLVHTSSTSAGHQFKDGVFGPIEVDHSYTEVLPSLNLNVSLDEQTQLRFGLSRALARPPLVEMRTGFQLDSQSPVKTGSGGNPLLDPFVANQLDVGIEYFWEDNHALTTSFFFKDLESHIGSSTDKLTVAGIDYDFTGPMNGDGGQIKGLEVMYQQAFTFLPAPFDGLGVYSNYSYTDSNVNEFVPVENPLPLGGLSKHVGNLTLWYYREGLDAKVSYNYRSSFTRVGSWTPSEINSISAERTVDASVSYEVNEQLKLMLQAQNLTNEPSQSYFDNDVTRPGSYLEWGRRYLIGFSYSM